MRKLLFMQPQNSVSERWGLWCETIDGWLMENRKIIASWSTEKEAESFRKNHTVHKDMYKARIIND